jgi:hypothetical protein
MYFFNANQSNSSTSEPKKIQTTSNDNNGEYRSIVKDGQYVTSAARGLIVTSESSFNSQSF